MKGLREMHREDVRERVLRCNESELYQWREHVLFCLKWFRKANNTFEIEECEYLLGLLNSRLATLEKDIREE